jgi:thiol:disulfide interchange protein
MNYEEPDLISNMRENQQNIEKLKHQTMNTQSNSNGSLLTAVSTAKTTDLALKLNNNESNKISPISNGKSHVSQNQQQQHKQQQIEQQQNNPENNYINSNKVNVLKCDNQIKELHTVLRDKHTSHSDFKFYSDRLIRLLVEESLNVLPYSDLTVTTSAGCEYQGVKYIKKVCGVSIMRSGEAMEKGLRVS